LHVDRAHLFGNLGFGAAFLYLAARLLGSGVAFGTMVGAAALGNVLDAALMPLSQSSMGASTMVFATLGLLASYSWRLKMTPRMKWAHRWAPLIVGVMMLALLGSGGPETNTDVLAHLAGFVFGVLFGTSYARVSVETFKSTKLQIVAASVAIAALTGAWAWAGAAG
jgi:membrane associated rhomboid family serine protease